MTIKSIRINLFGQFILVTMLDFVRNLPSKAIPNLHFVWNVVALIWDSWIKKLSSCSKRQRPTSFVFIVSSLIGC